MEAARAGGKIAGEVRKAVEAQIGVPVIRSKNAAQLNQVVINLIESGIPTAEAPKIVVGQVICSHAEELAQLQQVGCIRHGGAPLPAGDGLAGYQQIPFPFCNKSFQPEYWGWYPGKTAARRE